MIVCVAGTGFVSQSAAEDLIEDMFAGYVVEFIFPRHLVTAGQKNALAAISKFNSPRWSVSRVPLGNLNDIFISHTDQDKILLALDPDTANQSHIITAAVCRKIPVYDLTRAMYPVAASGWTESDEQTSLVSQDADEVSRA